MNNMEKYSLSTKIKFIQEIFYTIYLYYIYTELKKNLFKKILKYNQFEITF